MRSRSTHAGRLDELEAAVLGFGRAVAAGRPSARAPHHRGVTMAVDALRAAPVATSEDRRRIAALEDVDFHLRHIDRLVETLALSPHAPDVRPALDALGLALTVFETRGGVRLERLDRRVGDILATVERPLLERGAGSVADARLRRIALHVLAVGEASGFAPPPDRTPTPAPAA